MTLEANKALARKILGLWAGNANEDARAFIADTYVNHQEPFVDDGANDLGLEAWLALVEGHKVAFPDCRVEILRQVAEGDTVATRWRFSATNKGPYLGRPATNKPLSWTGIEIDVIKDGKIIESWVDWDMVRQLRQLGHIA
ncbi:MAG: ester cyclase [Pseudomonadota bacterium]